MAYKINFLKSFSETQALWLGVIVSQILGIWRGYVKYQSLDHDKFGGAFDTYAATVAIVGGIFAIIGRQLAINSRNKALNKADGHSKFLEETREVTLKAIKDYITGGDSFPVVTTHIQDNKLSLGLRYVGDISLVDVSIKKLFVLCDHKTNEAYNLELKKPSDNPFFIKENGAVIIDMPLRLDFSQKSGILTKEIQLKHNYFYLESTIQANNGKFVQSTWYSQGALFTRIDRTQGDFHENHEVIFECGHESFPWDAIHHFPKKAFMLDKYDTQGRGIASKYFQKQVEKSFGLYMS